MLVAMAAPASPTLKPKATAIIREKSSRAS